VSLTGVCQIATFIFLTLRSGTIEHRVKITFWHALRKIEDAGVASCRMENHAVWKRPETRGTRRATKETRRTQDSNFSRVLPTIHSPVRELKKDTITAVRNKKRRRVETASRGYVFAWHNHPGNSVERRTLNNGEHDAISLALFTIHDGVSRVSLPLLV